MRTEKLIVSGIFTVLLLAFTIAPAFASLTWTQGDTGVTWALDPTGDATPGKDIVKVGVGVEDNQYIFRMYLHEVPTSADSGTIYGIYLGLPELGAASPEEFSGSVESMLRNRNGLFYSYLQSDSSSIPLAGFNILSDGILQWKVDESSIASSWFYMMGATLNATGTIHDQTGVAATPIPATAWLLGSGIIGLIGIMRRNQKRSYGETHSPA